MLINGFIMKSTTNTSIAISKPIAKPLILPIIANSFIELPNATKAIQEGSRKTKVAQRYSKNGIDVTPNR